MKSFKQLFTESELFELGDSKIDVSIKNNILNAGNFTTEFKVDGITFQFNAVSGPSGWEVLFSREVGNKWVFDALGDMTIRQSLTVFSAVKKSFDMWIKAMKKAGKEINFSFSAKKDEASRMKIYDKMAKKIAKDLKADLSTGTGEVKGHAVRDYIFKTAAAPPLFTQIKLTGTGDAEAIVKKYGGKINKTGTNEIIAGLPTKNIDAVKAAISKIDLKLAIRKDMSSGFEEI